MSPCYFLNATPQLVTILRGFRSIPVSCVHISEIKMTPTRDMSRGIVFSQRAITKWKAPVDSDFKQKEQNDHRGARCGGEGQGAGSSGFSRIRICLKFLLPPSAMAGRAPSASGAMQVWKQEGSSREETVPFWGEIAGMLMTYQHWRLHSVKKTCQEQLFPASLTLANLPGQFKDQCNYIYENSHPVLTIGLWETHLGNSISQMLTCRLQSWGACEKGRFRLCKSGVGVEILHF